MKCKILLKGWHLLPLLPGLMNTLVLHLCHIKCGFNQPLHNLEKEEIHKPQTYWQKNMSALLEGVCLLYLMPV